MSDNRDCSDISQLILAENSDEEHLVDGKDECGNFGGAAVPFEPLASSVQHDRSSDDEHEAEKISI